MEWVIWWMQEMPPVRIDYAWRYGIPAPDPPSNKYPHMPFNGHIKYKEQEEEEEGKESAHDYDFNDGFFPEQPLVGGDKFYKPSQSSPIQCTSTRATETFVGCGNDLVIVEDRLASDSNSNYLLLFIFILGT
ncbi:hypothetical protein J1N35_034761, partial [Gossypium stocksii]